MHLIWHLRYPEELTESPPADAACAIGVRELANQVGIELPDTAAVYISDEPLLGTYGIGRLHRTGQSEAIYAVDYTALRRIMTTLADADFETGQHPERGTFEHEAYRILRRRLLHWPEEQVRELAPLLPQLKELALAMAPDHDHFGGEG